jgi:hypothetical protein
VPQNPHSLKRDGFSSPQDGQATVSTHRSLREAPARTRHSAYDEAAMNSREVA